MTEIVIAKMPNADFDNEEEAIKKVKSPEFFNLIFKNYIVKFIKDTNINKIGVCKCSHTRNC